MIKKLFTWMTVLCGAAALVSEQCAAAANWQTNMDRVLATAQAKGRTVLVEFTGSDWCPPCMHLRSQIFPTDAFAAYVREKKLLLVELDFPRDEKKLSAEQTAHNAKWMEYYGVSSFPTVLVVDGKGAPYGVVNGANQKPEEYLQRLNAELERKAATEAALAAAAKLQGVEKAQALANAIKYMPGSWRMLHKDVVQDIIDNDPEDTLGYKHQREEVALTQTQMQELSKIFSKYSGKMDRDSHQQALDEALQLVKDEKWMPIPRLYINKFISDSYALMGRDVNKVHEYLKAAIESAPQSEDARKLRPWLENLERHMAEGNKAKEEPSAK